MTEKKLFIFILIFIQCSCYYFNTMKLTSQNGALLSNNGYNGQGIVFQDRVYFVASDRACTSSSGCILILYRSDLSPSGTIPIKTLGNNYSANAYEIFYGLSNASFAFTIRQQEVGSEIWGVHISGSTTTVSRLEVDSGRGLGGIIQFGSKIAYVVPGTGNVSSSGKGLATIKVSDGTLAGTKNVISYNIELPYDFSYLACAPELETSIGSNHFIYYLPFCNKTLKDDQYSVVNYYTSDGTLPGTKFVFGSVNLYLSVSSFSFSNAGQDLLFVTRYVPRGTYTEELLGPNGVIGAISSPDVIHNFRDFAQIGGDVFFIGNVLDFGGPTNIYKLSSPYTTIQRWDQGDSNYEFDQLVVRNGALWVVDILSNGTKTPKIFSVNTQQPNSLSVVYSLPADAFDYRGVGYPYGYQVLSEGIVQYRAGGVHQLDEDRLDFLSFSGVNSVLQHFTRTSTGGAINYVSFGVLEYHGTLLYSVYQGDSGVSYPYISVPCGDAIVQYPETCDDGNNVDGDGCSGMCQSAISSTSSTGSSGSCVTGNSRCLTGNTYQTCAHSSWGPSQPCSSGLVCQPSGNFIYCVRPSSSSSSSSSASSSSSSASTSSGSSSTSSTSSSGCTDGNMRCHTSETYQACAHGQWGAYQSCSSGLTCHPSGNYIYCY